MKCSRCPNEANPHLSLAGCRHVCASCYAKGNEPKKKAKIADRTKPQNKKLIP